MSSSLGPNYSVPPTRYAACEVRGPNLLIARRCDVCGALATTVDDRVMGRLPEECWREHGNVTREVPVIVP